MVVTVSTETGTRAIQPVRRKEPVEDGALPTTRLREAISPVTLSSVKPLSEQGWCRILLCACEYFATCAGDGVDVNAADRR